MGIIAKMRIGTPRKTYVSVRTWPSHAGLAFRVAGYRVTVADCRHAARELGALSARSMRLSGTSQIAALVT